MGPRSDSPDRERRSRASRRVSRREERIDERGLVSARVLDAQQVRARREVGRERFRGGEAAGTTAAEEEDAREQPPLPSESPRVLR